MQAAVLTEKAAIASVNCDAVPVAMQCDNVSQADLVDSRVVMKVTNSESFKRRQRRRFARQKRSAEEIGQAASQ